MKKTFNLNLLTCLPVIKGALLRCHIPDINSRSSSIRAAIRIYPVEMFVEIIIFLLRQSQRNADYQHYRARNSN